MNRDQIAVRMGEIRDEMTRLSGHDTLTRSQDRRVSILADEIDALEAELRALDRDEQLGKLESLVRTGRADGSVRIEGPATDETSPAGRPPFRATRGRPSGR